MRNIIEIYNQLHITAIKTNIMKRHIKDATRSISSASSVSSVSSVSSLVQQRFPVTIRKAAGSYVETHCGRHLLDFTSGIGVLSLGHRHPAVLNAIMRQAESTMHTAQHVYGSQLREDVATKILGHTNLDKCIFSCSGSEAVENAVKIARAATRRKDVIAFQGGHHGRTLAALCMTTSKSAYKKNVGASGLGVHIMPYPAGKSNADNMLDLFMQTVHASDVAAVVIEPVLGEGGYVEANTKYLKELEMLCKKQSIALIVDEVQSGYARTGRMFAHQHAGISPDIIVAAKGIASGMPLSCVMFGGDMESHCTPGIVGGTYGGNELCLAAAAATLQVIETENLAQKAFIDGSAVIAELEAIASRWSIPLSITGLGLMIGVEFVHSITAEGFIRAMFSNNVLALPCGIRQAVRLAPPLNVTADEIEVFLGAFSRTLQKLRMSAP